MTADQIVELMRRTLETAVWLGAPLLLLATVVGLVVNIVQVLTSLQETMLSTVPRLAAVAAGLFFLMPWIVRRMSQFTVEMFSNFRPYLR